MNRINHSGKGVLVADGHEPKRSRPKVLFVVEGYSDIRFVTGLSEICELTMLVPSKQYRESGLRDRLLASGATVEVDELEGGRLRYQAASFRYLTQRARNFDVILSQEILRGSLNSCLVGRLFNITIVTYLNSPPLQYSRCRHERCQNSWWQAQIGEAVIRTLSWINAKLATECV